jgi:hypothetical protein
MALTPLDQVSRTYQAGALGNDPIHRDTAMVADFLRKTAPRDDAAELQKQIESHRRNGRSSVDL